MPAETLRPRARFLLAAIAGAALAGAALLGAACGSGDDEQQEQQGQAQQPQTEQAAPSTAAPASSSSSSGSSPSAATSASSDDAQVSDTDADDAQTTQSSVADSGESGDADMMMMQALTPAPYDELSPRLQLLTDAGYPVYLHPDGYTIALGTPDLGLGLHRVSVVIEGPLGLVEFPALGVEARHAFAAMESEPQGAVARFSRFPDGIRGFHVTSLDFDREGQWIVSLSIPGPDDFIEVNLAVEVREDTRAPAVGELAPRSRNRTLPEVGDLTDLSTGDEPDPGLYLVTIEEAAASGEPFVVVFASPGFCTNAFCGPQAEVLSELRQLYPQGVQYIHVDLYENPEAVRFGEEPVETPLLEEWGLETDEWTFIVGADGRVFARFEAFAPLEEVEAALTELLSQQA